MPLASGLGNEFVITVLLHRKKRDLEEIACFLEDFMLGAVLTRDEGCPRIYLLYFCIHHFIIVKLGLFIANL